MTNAPARVVFVVEDDAKIAAVLSDYLVHAGYTPEVFGDGRAALARLRVTSPAAILLDQMLPGIDGLALCRQLRQFCASPVLMVTARIDEAQRVQGLAAGADDYICKPFSAREVIARVDAQIRRAEGRVTHDPAAQPYAIDTAGMRIAWAGQWLALSPSEYQILATLMRHPGRVFTRAQLLDHMSVEFRDVSDRAIDSHIKNVRRKVTQIDPDAQCVTSIYGVGYRFDP